MKRLLFLAFLPLAGTAWAGSVYPVEGVETYRLDIHTGAYWPVAVGGLRYGPGIAWDRNTLWRGFVGADEDMIFRELLDWADVGTPENPVMANGFRFSYCTNGTGTVDLAVAFYIDEDGHNSKGATVVASYFFANLPGRNTSTGANCYQFDIDLPDPVFDQFQLAGNDLDADGRVDFGYSMTIVNCGNCAGEAGPLLADGPIATSPGSTPEYDVFSDGEYVRTDTGPAGTLGQFAMRIYTAGVIGCPHPGCDDGGIDVDFDNNCTISLSDLTQLLAGFGIASGATPDQGDTDADGDVDLNDLTNLLGRFGNDCN